MTSTSTTQRATAPTAGLSWLALGAAGLTVVAWASAFVAIRSTGESFSPGALALGRLIIGSVALGVLLAFRGSWIAPTRREWLLLAVCGLSWFTIYNVALNAAEQRIDAGTTAMLVNIGPILIAVFAGLFLGEGFPGWLVLGLVVAFAGALLIAMSTAQTDDADVLGVILCVVAAVTYAVGVVCQKPVLRRLPPIQVTWIACTIGMVACLPAVSTLISETGDAPGGALAGILYLGLVPTAIAFSTWAYALARMSAGRLGVTTYLVPPITIVMGWLLLDEAPTTLAMIGGAVCLVGVTLSRRHGPLRRAGLR
jgi:drug/metabolite transporter (DMT)-like permease